MPGYAKDGGKNVKMPDGKRKTFCPSPLPSTMRRDGAPVEWDDDHARDA